MNGLKTNILKGYFGGRGVKVGLYEAPPYSVCVLQQTAVSMLSDKSSNAEVDQSTAVARVSRKKNIF